MTRTEARAQLDALARQATALGFQVTFTSHTETEGCAAGRTLTGITVSTLVAP